MRSLSVYSLLLLTLFISATAFARRARKVPPLMPPPYQLAYVDDKKEAIESELATPPKPPKTSEVSAPQTGKAAKQAIAVEFGALGVKSDLDADFAGAQILSGVRLGAYWPVIGHSIFLKPTVGYFARLIDSSGLAITHHVIEAGITVEYAHIPYHGIQFAIGIAQRVDGLISNETSLSTTGVSNLSFRYRLAPTISIGTMVSRDISLLLNVEGGAVTASPIVPYAGATVGILYHLY